MAKKKIVLKYKNIFIVLLFIVFIFSTSKIILFYIDLQKSKQQNDKIIEEVIKEEITIDEANQTEEKTFSVDFEALTNKNKDTIGWIKYNNEKINYPIVKTSNNSYYLNHSFDKSYNETGTIFMDYRNNSFEDKNVVLYGHAMLDDTMFGSLQDIFQDVFFDDNENNIIQIMTKDNVLLEYQVFSYYIIKKEEYYITTSFKSSNDFYNFIDTLTRRSYQKFDIEVSTKDNILTLSTCHGTGGTTLRKVLHAVRKK